MTTRAQPGLDGLLSDAAGLPSGPCKTCEREVLAHLLVADEDPGAEPADLWVCVHCGTPLRRIAWVDEADLERLGYSLSDPAAQKACGTGCGRGCGSSVRTSAVKAS